MPHLNPPVKAGTPLGGRGPLRIVHADEREVVLEDEAPGGLSEYFRSVSKLSRLAGRYWFDAVILGGLAWGLTVTVRDQGKVVDPPNGPLWLDVLLVTAIIAPLLARRRFPFGALAAVPLAVVAATLLDDRLIPDLFVTFFAGCAAVFLMGLLRDRRLAVAGLALVFAAEIAVARTDHTSGAGDFFFAELFFVAVWVVGFMLGRKFEETDLAKERAVRAELEREERAHAAVAEERARIARELHDVVGHSVSVMTVQASGVRRLLRPDQERERRGVARRRADRPGGAGRDAPDGRRAPAARGGARAGAAAEHRPARPARRPGARRRPARRAADRGRGARASGGSWS